SPMRGRARRARRARWRARPSIACPSRRTISASTSVSSASWLAQTWVSTSAMPSGWLLHARGTARAAEPGRARAAAERPVIRRVGTAHDGAARRAVAAPHPLSRSQGLSRRGRAPEGGPRRDGLLIGGARAAARSPRGGDRRRDAAADEAAWAHDQARAEVAGGPPLARRHRPATQTRPRRAARALVSDGAAAAGPRGMRGGRAAPRGTRERRGGDESHSRAHARRSRSPQEALYTAGAAAVDRASPRGLSWSRVRAP